ncbi:MAG: cytochrome c [Dehalococcoidia bacterium]
MESGRHLAEPVYNQTMIAARMVGWLALAFVLTSCGSDLTAEGRRLVVQKGCTGCHVIPGADPPFGSIGPSLVGFGRQSSIAGTVPNTPENLARWLVEPASLKPATQMPAVRLTPVEASAIAAYLATLKG